ncbi:MAG: hypothetical protein DCF25_22015 [Leptolyngbya foveolarum]|uniref:ASCH domain-containing protein n=1 Tax=Leptolyngbya foveolarum TaxID=47253 RepID=A0A2W4VPC7_9CYAN|nr:MAG: hypothetical protein DCF25_22015 [Leptolyngbya foveolarum]
MDDFLEFEYAITLHRPWPYAIAHLGKDIENRTRNLLCVKPQGWLAIHAGRGYDFTGEDWIRQRFPDCHLPELTEQRPGIIAISQFLGNVSESQSVWFGGPVGWQLGEVKVLLDAVDCPGKQGPWKPSEEIKNAVYENLKVPF